MRESLEKIRKDKSLRALQLLVEHFREEYDVTPSQLLDVISPQEDTIPVSAFSNPLSGLQIIVKYLKEEKELTYHEIAVMLKRDDRTIWSTYSNCIKRMESKLLIKNSDMIPLSIFSIRTYSVLESLVIYLKDELKYSFNEIAEVLGKNYQTIYTSYRRGVAKDA